MSRNNELISGGSKGHPNSFNFMQFLREFGKIVCSRPLPPGGFTSPPGGNPGSVAAYCDAEDDTTSMKNVQ